MAPVWWILSLYCGLILCFSAAGGLVPLQRGLTHTRLQLYLSFAAGVMLGSAVFHMLPQALHLLVSSSTTFELMALGLLALFLIERFFTSHHHEHPLAGQRADLFWPAAVVGLSLHTLAAGIALASAVAATGKDTAGSILGLGVFLAIVLHKPADSLTVVALMLSGGASRARAHLANMLFALVVPVGVVLFFAARSLLEQDMHVRFTGGALACSAGMFLCIALSDLLPELHFHAHDRIKLSLALLAGVGLMFLAAKMEP